MISLIRFLIGLLFVCATFETEKIDITLSDSEIANSKSVEEEVDKINGTDLKSKNKPVGDKSGKKKYPVKTNMDKILQNDQEETVASKKDILSLRSKGIVG